MGGCVASVVQHGVKKVGLQCSLQQTVQELRVATGSCKVQWRPSLRVSTQSGGTMFQQSRYTVLTSQRGL